MDSGVLDPDLLQRLPDCGQATPLVLPGKKHKKKRTNRNEEQAFTDSSSSLAHRPHNAIPSRKRKKVKSSELFAKAQSIRKDQKIAAGIEASKLRRQKRKELLISLEKTQLSNAEKSVMVSSATLGKTKKFRKDKLRDEILLSKVGLGASSEDAVNSVDVAPSENIKGCRSIRNKILEPKKSGPAKFVSVDSGSSNSESETEDDEESDSANGYLNTAAEGNTAIISAFEDDSQANQVDSQTYGGDDGFLHDLDKEPDVKEKVMSASTSSKLEVSKTMVAPLRKSVYDINPSAIAERFVFRVKREPDVEDARRDLPVVMMEQKIMECIEDNFVSVISGETGSGKTTQVPQFLLEAGFGHPENPNLERRGLVVVTQPRRVAAISMAQRVAHELGTPLVSGNGDLRNKNIKAPIVGYHVRHGKSGIGEETRLKFVTDGILLREVKEDVLLRRYSAIIIDEAHERNINTDILIGILSRIVPLREEIYKDGSIPGVYPLKVVIMSATLRVEDFTSNPNLFASFQPPVISVKARQFPVTMHFSRRTEQNNYLAASFRKVCAIHTRLPPGGILVFLTGQREIEWMCKELRRKFECNVSKIGTSVESKRRAGRSAENDESIEKNGNLGIEEEVDFSDIDSDLDEEDSVDNRDRLDAFDELNLPISAKDRIKDASKRIMRSISLDCRMKVRVLPLYSRLPASKQLEVFKDVPADVRLVVVATNVAETSITIPGIRYVVDSGREKRRVFDPVTGTSKFEVGWVSKANAEQRSGRAGRTGPGHCYRLYSSTVFSERFVNFPPPEIASMPVDEVVLYMKSMGIEEIKSFPFPSPPDVSAIEAATSRLAQLGGLVMSPKRLGSLPKDSDYQITALGRRMANFPVPARLAKMLAVASMDMKQSIERVKYVIALVSALSLQDPFLHYQILNEGASGLDDEKGVDDISGQRDIDDSKKAVKDRAKAIGAQWKDRSSDALTLLIATGAYSHAASSGNKTSTSRFCHENFLHAKTMKEQKDLYRQLTRISAKLRVETHSDDCEYDIEIDERDEDEIEELGSTDELRTMLQRLSGPLIPVSQDDRVYLRQVLATGHLDQVARKLTKEQALALRSLNGDDADARKQTIKSWPYLSCNTNIDEPLHIHSQSSVYSGNPNELPDFVVYDHVDTPVARKEKDEEEQLVRYMKRVTAIDASWLYELSAGTIQCSLGPVLEQPPPTYDARNDVLLACLNPYFGPRKWKLASQWLPFPCDFDEERVRLRARWFGRALLEGKVFPELVSTIGNLKIPAAYMTRKPHDPRVESLTRALCVGSRMLKTRRSDKRAFRPVFSSAQLRAAWQNDPMYLAKELGCFVRKEAHEDFLKEFRALSM